MDNHYNITVELIRYVLKGDAVKSSITDIDAMQLYNFSKSHGIENMIYAALKRLKINIPNAVMAKFEKSYKLAIMLEAVQSFELEAIEDEFDAQGIDYVPLKGSVVKYLYPMPDYRKSGDIDILIRCEDEKKVMPIMDSLGYTRERNYDKHEVHLSYEKPPYIEVEVHRSLTTIADRTYHFCKNIWDYVEPDKDRQHCYVMNNESLYTYLLAHMCKHLYSGGAGLRLVTDMLVLKNKLEFNEIRLKKYLRKANLVQLNDMVNKLIDKWFYDKYEYDKDIEILEQIILSGGSFGTAEMHNALRSSNTTANKFKLLIQRLCPPVRILKGRYPFLEKIPVLLPFMWIYRVFDIGIFERDTIEKKIVQTVGTSKGNADLGNIVKAIRDRQQK